MGKTMERYIVFDADCSTCTRLAKEIEEASDGMVETLSIYDWRAKALLNRAYPQGWTHTPYFVVVKQGKVHAWRGLGLAFQLVKLIGPVRAWRIWRLGRSEGVVLPPRTDATFTSFTRRQFLKSVIAISAAIAASRVPVAHGCVPCDDCVINCYPTGCGCAIPCTTNYRVCTRYDCYDAVSGEYCGSFCANCSPCGYSCA